MIEFTSNSGNTSPSRFKKTAKIVEPDVPTPVPLPRTEVERAVYAALVLAGESR